MRPQATLIDFIDKAKAVHGEKYSYTEYNGALTACRIFCVECDKPFWQLPSNHLAGRGCPQCAKRKQHKHDRISFAEAGIAKHDGKFEYIDLPERIFTESKIKLRCKPCNIIFEQWVREHLKGRNSCPGCGPRTMTQKRFIREAVEIHGDKYDYSKVEYVYSRTCVVIICRSCDTEFSQTPGSHLNQKQGCPSCGSKRKGQGLKQAAYERFLEHAKLNELKYGYSRSVYVNNKTKMLIECLTCHEDFEQRPFNHVVMKQGCPRCARLAQNSKGEIAWLDSLDIPLESRNRFITLSNGRKVNVDAFHDGIVYEFYGRYWHGDPRTTDQTSIHAFLQVLMSEVYSDTLERHRQIVASGHEIRFVWEDDREQGATFSERHPHEGMIT